MTVNRGHLASLCNWSTGKNPEYLLQQCMKRSFFYLLKIIGNSELLLFAERGKKIHNPLEMANMNKNVVLTSCVTLISLSCCLNYFQNEG